MEIVFGALSPKLSEQLADTNISKNELKLFDRMADAITLLSIQSIIPPYEVDKARKRLITRIERGALSA